MTPGVGEILDQLHQGLEQTVINNPPYGFVNFDDFSPAPDISSLRMTRLDYTGVLAFCGQTAKPEMQEAGEVDIEAPLTLDELFKLRGHTSIGGLGGYLLHKGVQREFLQIRDAEDISTVEYTRRGERKVPDVGIGTGMKAMGMLAQRGVEAMLKEGGLSDTEMIDVLIASQEALPMAFADMARRNNNRTEVLYGVKDGGAFTEESARYELYQNDSDEFDFVFSGGELVATNFDKVKRVLDTPGKCAAINHPVFTTTWQQVSKNTVRLLAGGPVSV